MPHEELRKELKQYYFEKLPGLARKHLEKCTARLEKEYCDRDSGYIAKAKQYEIIADACEPVLFMNTPYYFELGSMISECDGAGEWRGNIIHPGGFLYRKRQHRFADQDPALFKKVQNQKEELLYLICGNYCDERQHFAFYYPPVFKNGLKGIYEAACVQLESSGTQEEREYLQSTCRGLLAVKKIAEKFADKADEKRMQATEPDEIRNLKLISDTARRIPWNRPETFYEALNTYAFLRMAVGALEGIGVNSFGRVDVDLYPFYKKDLEENRITEAEAFELVSQFLLIWDCRYDPEKKMVYYSDHEYENTYTLGGCDKDGNPVFNKVTEFFLLASEREKVIYPKIKCRFGKNTPRAYFDLVNEPIINGRSIVLYQNDEATVPALVKAGLTLEQAADYIIDGCWDLKNPGCEKPDGGAYLNILKPFEFSLHNRTDLMEKCGIWFEPLKNAETFEDVYRITVENISKLMRARSDIAPMARIWKEIDPLPLLSCAMNDCIKKHKDFTAGGAEYNDDSFLLMGFPNLTDSLLAIKRLCFDEKVCTLETLLRAVQNNWKNAESLRMQALHCPYWGDNSEESSALAHRLSEDLCKASAGLESRWGGKFRIGHLTYTEIRWWGERTLATPDGRFSGEYIAQGLTPSRLHQIGNAVTPIRSFDALDMTKCSGNTVINVILSPDGMNLDRAYAYLCAVADSGVQSLQLNCFSKEQLLDAQKHPENYTDLVVRVCGFSARFTSLSPEWQKEVIERNFYRS